MITPERLRERLHYDPETGIFRWRVRPHRRSRRRAGDVAGYLQPQGYISIRIDTVGYRAHRLAWLYVYGCWPKPEVDHINRDRSDNRLANLREATRTQNAWNTDAHASNTSGVRGVYWHKRAGKWHAQIAAHGQMIYLGLFDSIEEAGAAYRAAEIKRNSLQPLLTHNTKSFTYGANERE